MNSDDENKVFYNTSGLQLKNSLSNGTWQTRPANKKMVNNKKRVPASLEQEMKKTLRPVNIRETVLMKKPT